jgi:hypothetical protein
MGGFIMGKNLQYKILLSLLAAGSISVYGFVNTAAAQDFNAPDDGTTVNGDYANVYGNGEAITIKGGVIDEIYGIGNDLNYNTDASGGDIAINGGTVKAVYGGFSTNGDAIQNYITINNGNITSTVYGGFSSYSNASDNYITMNDGTVGAIEGGHAGLNGTANNNHVTINGGTITGNVRGAKSQKGEANNNSVTINGGIINGEISGGYGGNSETATTNNNIVNITDGTINGDIYGGNSSRGNASYNEVIISGGTINGNVYGATAANYSYANSNNNIIEISANANIENASLFGTNTQLTKCTDNTLTINGWSGFTKSVKNFNDINFDNINWQNGGTVLTITEGADKDLANTEINLNSIAGGSKIAVGDTMTLIESSNNVDLGINKDNVKVSNSFFAGVAAQGTGTATVKDDGSVEFKVNTFKLNDQIDLVAENRAVAAAFVNQGTDLISDSLDTISRDDNYGVKTFAAVHGNRSKYDVNSDIKINGWSTIVGVGNASKFDNGSEFSWGVFYENGSGNYRTYNEFNNEFFRGDGSLVYNGSGVAARYTNKNGVYTEGSLRAGMLKSDMDNALRDGAGNFYGYESESAYYGAHIGIGKIISLSESSDLDVYGKFFHTYTEGDSFKVANDEFEFDSINSDRLRIGARITSNKENKFSTYYGLAYEYEFNGDADMTAQGLKAPTQSLQGSSVMAEVGFNYQPTPTSPWSFDLNMRGYAGERQGGSFNVQATYTF